MANTKDKYFLVTKPKEGNEAFEKQIDIIELHYRLALRSIEYQ